MADLKKENVKILQRIAEMTLGIESHLAPNLWSIANPPTSTDFTNGSLQSRVWRISMHTNWRIGEKQI